MRARPFFTSIGMAIIGLVLLSCSPAYQVDQRIAPQIRESEALFKQGHYDQALESIEAAAQTTDNGSDIETINRLVSRWAYDLYRRSLYVWSARYYEFTVALSQRSNAVDRQIDFLNSLARNQIIIARYQEAEHSLQQAHGLAESIANHRLRAATAVSFGYLHYNLRSYRTAADHLDRAAQIAETIDAHDLKADALLLSAAVYRQQGDFERARTYLTSALDLYNETGAPLETGATLRNLGELYLHRIEGGKADNLGQAEVYLKRAMAIQERERDQLGYAMTLSHLGELTLQRDEYAQAVDHYRDAGAIFENAGFVDGNGRMHVHLGFAYEKMGDHQAALESFDMAIETYGALQDREWTRVALYGKGLVFENQARKADAERSYKEAVELFESIRGEVAGGEAAQNLFTEANSKIYENLVGLLVKRGDIQGALAYIERSRLKALQDYVIRTGRENQRLRGDDDPMAQYRRLQNENRAIRGTLGAVNDSQTRDVLMETLAKNEAEALTWLRKLGRDHRQNFLSMNLVSATASMRRRTHYPDDLALLVYFVTAEKLYIFVIKKGKQVSVKGIPVSKTQLQQWIGEARALITATATTSLTSKRHSQMRSALKRLYRHLIGPVEAELSGGIETVAILPFSWLSYMPFEALIHASAEGREAYFIEEKNIVYLPNQSAVDLLYRFMDEQQGPLANSIVAFGNPDIGYENMDFPCGPTAGEPIRLNPDQMPPLPCAEVEVKKIRGYFPKSVVYTRKEASRQNFETHWGRHEILHIAAHARLTEEGTEFLLAPQETGTLTLDDIFRLNENGDEGALNTRFVALSACQTAVDTALAAGIWKSPNGLVQEAGIPMAGAVHGFQLLRIPKVLATLWRISDEGTPELMGQLYRHLRDGHGYYASFRRAQLDMIRQKGIYRQPFYWAGFVFYGLPEL